MIQVDDDQTTSIFEVIQSSIEHSANTFMESKKYLQLNFSMEIVKLTITHGLENFQKYCSSPGFESFFDELKFRKRDSAERFMSIKKTLIHYAHDKELQEKAVAHTLSCMNEYERATTPRSKMSSSLYDLNKNNKRAAERDVLLIKHTLLGIVQHPVTAQINALFRYDDAAQNVVAIDRIGAVSMVDMLLPVHTAAWEFSHSMVDDTIGTNCFQYDGCGSKSRVVDIR
jgi:hypothetical protein